MGHSQKSVLLITYLSLFFASVTSGDVLSDSASYEYGHAESLDQAFLSEQSLIDESIVIDSSLMIDITALQEVQSSESKQYNHMKLSIAAVNTQYIVYPIVVVLILIAIVWGVRHSKRFETSVDELGGDGGITYGAKHHHQEASHHHDSSNHHDGYGTIDSVGGHHHG